MLRTSPTEMAQSFDSLAGSHKFLEKQLLNAIQSAKNAEKEIQNLSTKLNIVQQENDS